MNLRSLLLPILVLLTVYACAPDKEKVTDNIPVIQEDVDTMDNVFLSDLDTNKKVHEVKEFKENLKNIEARYGEQWGFCECVVANDSVNNAIVELTDFEGPEVERLMARLDFISNKCQAFLGMDGSKTPEERAIHEKKVRDCLKKSKKK